MNVYAVVPVAPFEPESVITKSIEFLQELEHDDFSLEVYYIIDTFPGDTRELHWELPDNFKILLRPPRGRKAGAVNDFLTMIEDADDAADYVAIIDVDVRPAKDFLPKCIAALEENDSAIFSSGRRLVNNKSTILAKLQAMEWSLGYTLTAGPEDFCNLGGVGVWKGSLLKGERFDEKAASDDIEFHTRMYLKGKVAVLVETSFRERPATTLREFYHQRVRWSRAFAESFSKYFIPMVRASIPFTRKLSWLLVVVVGPFFAPFLSLIALPLFLARPNKEKSSGDSFELVKLFFFTPGYTWLLTIIGIVGIIQHATSAKFEWKPTGRYNV